MQRVSEHLDAFRESIVTRTFASHISLNFVHYCVPPSGFMRKKDRSIFNNEIKLIPAVNNKLHVHHLHLLNFTIDSTSMQIHAQYANTTVYLKARRLNSWYAFYEQVDMECPPEQFQTMMIMYQKHAEETGRYLFDHLCSGIRYLSQNRIDLALDKVVNVEWQKSDRFGTDYGIWSTSFEGDNLYKFPRYDYDKTRFKVTISGVRFDERNSLIFDVKSEDGRVNSTYEARYIQDLDDYFRYRIVKERKHTYSMPCPGLEYHKLLYADIQE